MKSKLFLSLLVIMLFILAYFAFPIVKDRYFADGNADKNISQGKPEAADEIPNHFANSTEDSAEITDEIEENEAEPVAEVKDETDESGNVDNISAADCDNECATFKDQADNLRYCQDICDLSPIKDSENCDTKQRTDKDYCFKNQAVLKVDLEICDSISDAKIKSSCKNRVTEDLLEQQ